MFEPPSLPAAGWYPDPYRPGARRWWNGSDWVAVWDDGHAEHASLEGELPDIGPWLNDSFRLALGRWRASLLIGLVTAAGTSVLIGLAFRHVLADVTIVDNEVVGWSGDRLPLGIGLTAVAVFLGLIGQLGLAVLMLRTVDGEAPAPSATDEFRQGGSAMVRAIRVIPRVIGWSALVGLAAAVIVLCIVGLMLVTPALGILAIVVLFPALVFVGVRLAFMTQSLVDRPGQPFTRSWDVSHGRWWATFGRLLLIGLIVWLISVVLQTVNGVATGNAGNGFGQNSFEVDNDGNIARFELIEAFPGSALAIITGAVAAVITTIVATAVASAAASILYRTRNPPD